MVPENPPPQVLHNVSPSLRKGSGTSEKRLCAQERRASTFPPPPPPRHHEKKVLLSEIIENPKGKESERHNTSCGVRSLLSGAPPKRFFLFVRKAYHGMKNLQETSSDVSPEDALTRRYATRAARKDGVNLVQVRHEASGDERGAKATEGGIGKDRHRNSRKDLDKIRL